MSNRMPVLLGTAAIGGIGYYLYRFGGDVNAAKRAAKNDLTHVSGFIKHDLKEFDAQSSFKLDIASAKVDNTVAQKQAELEAANNKANSYLDEACHNTPKISQFDRKVDESVSKVKGVTRP